MKVFAPAETNVFKKLSGDHLEPRCEPVDCAAAYERRKQSYATSERVTDQTHRQHNMQIGLGAFNQKVEQCHRA